MSERTKSFFLTPEVHDYLVGHSRAPDAVLRDLAEQTRRAVGGLWIMQIAPEQGAFMELLARLSGARRAVEVGTFTGYSAICLARGLGEGGRLLCLDASEEWTAIARRYWRRAGLDDRIELRLGPAAQTLSALPCEPLFDLAFIDADKPNYLVYYEAILARMPVGGLVIADNVLWSGAVVDPEKQDEQTRALRAYNDFVAADPRVETSMIPVGDGLLLARKR